MIRQFFEPGGPNKDIKAWLNLAPQSVMLTRRNLGLNAVLARLGATANWHRIAQEIWPWTNSPPSTPLGEEEAAWMSRPG